MEVDDADAADAQQRRPQVMHLERVKSEEADIKKQYKSFCNYQRGEQHENEDSSRQRSGQSAFRKCHWKCHDPLFEICKKQDKVNIHRGTFM